MPNPNWLTSQLDYTEIYAQSKSENWENYCASNIYLHQLENSPVFTCEYLLQTNKLHTEVWSDRPSHTALKDIGLCLAVPIFRSKQLFNGATMLVDLMEDAKNQTPIVRKQSPIAHMHGKIMQQPPQAVYSANPDRIYTLQLISADTENKKTKFNLHYRIALTTDYNVGDYTDSNDDDNPNWWKE
jgi:hypothetical protein